MTSTFRVIETIISGVTCYHAFTPSGKEAIFRLQAEAMRYCTDDAFRAQVDRLYESNVPEVAQQLTSGTGFDGKCRECNHKLIREEGCIKCMNCGWSKC